MISLFRFYAQSKVWRPGLIATGTSRSIDVRGPVETLIDELRQAERALKLP